MRAITLGYHDVTEDGAIAAPSARVAAAAYSLGIDEFRRHMDAVEAAAPGKVAAPASADGWGGLDCPVLLTFDDGAFGAHAYIADELERHGWRGYFFITTDWIGRDGFMTREQILDLHRRGHVIGSHTVSHPNRMSALSWDRLVEEWSVSRRILSDLLGAGVATASVADGYYSHQVGLSAAASGFDMLFHSIPTPAVGEVEGCLVLGRYSIQAATPASDAASIAAGKIGVRWRQSMLWHGKGLVKSLAGEHYLALRARLLSSKRRGS